MNIRTFLIATAIVASATSYAFAQSPNGTPGGAKAEPDSSKPMGSETMSKDKIMKRETMGAGTMGPSTAGTSGATGEKVNGQILNKNVSPASPEAGEKQQK